MTELCADCFHEEANHDGICNATLTCLCQKFIPQELEDFAADIDRYKYIALTVKARVLHMILRLPHLGDNKISDKSFSRIYKSYWHAFWPGKNTIFTKQKYNEMPSDSDIEREKRRILNTEHPELKIFDRISAEKKAAKYQAYVELATIDRTL